MSGNCARPETAMRPVFADLERRFSGFPTPAGPFNPATAAPELLRRYGLPPKPGARAHPALRRAWERGFGKPMQLQAFTFDRQLVERTKYRLFSRQLDRASGSPTPFESSENWSGAYITANRDRQFLQVWGMWKIPENLQLPPLPLQGPANVPYACSNWIGLDGQRLYLDSSLPQIGTVSKLEADGTTTAEAWTQWWARNNTDNAPLPLGLVVAPGDEVLCVITALDPRTVILAMVNLSTAIPTGMAVLGASPQVTLPDGSTVRPDIAGATAEWIMERPQIVGQATAYNFPDYDETAFKLCVAVEGDEVDIFAWFNGVPQQLEGTRRIRMFDVFQGPARTAFISMPRKLGADSVHLRYGSFLPV